jgi:tripartite-type tricarboxylate transporter receptor subunit TctC
MIAMKFEEAARIELRKTLFLSPNPTPPATAGGGAAVVAAPLTQALAQGGNWPAKPITLSCPQAPGGANDVIARAVAQGWRIRWASPSSWKTAPVPTAIWARARWRAAADGYTFLVTAQSAYTINPARIQGAVRSHQGFHPVMQLAVAPYLLVVNPNFPAKNLDELVAYAKAHPGKVEYASAGNGTLNHLWARC